MARLIVLDDAIIRKMLRTSKIVQEFPFLSAASAKEAKLVSRTSSRCGGCSRGEKSRADYSGVRRAIAGMSDEKKQKLKQMLNADKIRVYFYDNKRQATKLTF